MLLKRSLLYLVFCKMYGVCLEYENPVKASETRYGYKLLCIPRCIPINQVKDNKLVSEIIMNSNSNQPESEYFNGVGYDNICSNIELFWYCITCFMNCIACFMNYAVVQKLDLDLPDTGWEFMITFLPNKLKHPVRTVNEQSPVPETDNPETPDLTLCDN